MKNRDFYVSIPAASILTAGIMRESKTIAPSGTSSALTMKYAPQSMSHSFSSMVGLVKRGSSKSSTITGSTSLLGRALDSPCLLSNCSAAHISSRVSDSVELYSDQLDWSKSLCERFCSVRSNSAIILLEIGSQEHGMWTSSGEIGATRGECSLFESYSFNGGS